MSRAVVLLNPIISHPRKKKGVLIISAPFAVGRRTKERTWKNQSLQPRTTKRRIWVLQTDALAVQNATLYLAKSYFEAVRFHRCLKYVLCPESFHSKNEKAHSTWNWKCVYTVQKQNQVNLVLKSVSKISKHYCALNKSRKKKIWNERMKRTWKSSWRRQNYTTFNLRKVKYNGTPLQ